jgi:hypothetical protein
MSTIGTNSEDLILNADGSGSDIKFKSNGTEVASISDGGVMTATSFAGSGANLTGVGVAGISSSADATAITIDSNENVGIGVNPSYRFHVKTSVDGDFAALIHNEDVDNGQGLMIKAGADSGEAILSARNQASSEKFKVLADGRGLSAFTAKCWCVLNGTGTVAINDSHNVSSITDQGTGYYFVRYANNLSTIACSFVTLGLPGSYNDEHAFCEEQGNNDSIRVDIRRAGNGTQVDNDRVMVVVFDN